MKIEETSQPSGQHESDKQSNTLERAKFNGRIMVSGDSILPRCTKVKIRFGKHICDVTGYVSEASGSLLVPARNFSKEIPKDIRDSLNWSDPNKYLSKYEPSKAEGNNLDTLRVKSALSQSGYSVRAGIPKDNRQEILSKLISNGKLSKNDIIKHLDFLISIHKTQHPGACIRWQEDIDYVQQL